MVPNFRFVTSSYGRAYDVFVKIPFVERFHESGDVDICHSLTLLWDLQPGRETPRCEFEHPGWSDIVPYVTFGNVDSRLAKRTLNSE
jgi:hypothetical protein